MAEDWNFISDKNICSLRVAGIVLRDGKILLDHILDTGEYWLPGGHVEIGETTEACLLREFQEESALAVKIKKLAYVSENFRHWHDYQTYFIEFGYVLEVEAVEVASFSRDDSNVKKEWHELSDLSKLTTSPENLSEVLANLSKTIQHFVSRG